MGHKDEKIKRLEKRIRQLEKERGIERTKEFEQKVEWNRWSHVDYIFPFVHKVLTKVRANKWSWARNWNCKYIDIRIDMRDGGAIVLNNAGERISHKQLEYQYKPGDEDEG